MKSKEIYGGDFPDGPVFKTRSSASGGVGLIPGPPANILPHASWSKTKTWDRSHIVTNSIKTFKMVHIKKNLKKIKELYSCWDFF